MTRNTIDISKLMDSLIEKTIDGLDRGYADEPETHIVDAKRSLKEAKNHLVAYVKYLDQRADKADEPEDFGDPIVSRENTLYAISTIDDMILELM